MKKFFFFLMGLLLSLSTLTVIYAQEESTAISAPDEFETLVKYLEPTASFIKGELPIILADEVKQNFKNPKYHIIDIRSDSWFEYAHIKNAANIPSSDLLTYFETKINPSDFEKIVLVCYSGQSAAYYSGLLRMAGYDNVYSMKWGMSSWREDFANNAWNKNVKNEFAAKLETKENLKPEAGNHPSLVTGKTEVQEILKARLETLFATPYSDFILKSPDVFENPSNYFIVNYVTADNYNNGHIPGAIQYEPGKSLLFETDLLTLPTDKKVAVYTITGQEAAYMIAYLNVLGYDTGNIAYGENGFMNEVLQNKGWDAFTKKEINMYPVVE